MKLLAGKLYDPAAAVSQATTSLLAMTAFDTTNLRLTFTAPSNGSVLVRTRGVATGASTVPTILMGVLQSSSVICRQAPIMGPVTNSTVSQNLMTTSMVVTGLTPGTSYTWDLAYGVEVVVASTAIKYGGPDNATTNNAWGGLSFEVWDTPGLLASIAYDPASASTTTSIGTAIAMTAIDTTNLRLSFTAPSSGIVQARVRGTVSGTTAAAHAWLLGILDGSTVRLRMRGFGGKTQEANTEAATDQISGEAVGLVTGLTPGTSYTWDAAYGVENVMASGLIKMGGPDNTTTDDAWGQFAFDVWNVDSLPRAIGSVA